VDRSDLLMGPTNDPTDSVSRAMGPFTGRFIKISLFIAAPRLGAFWFVLWSIYTDQQSLTLLPLIMLLYPEALMVSNDIEWAIGSVLLFNAMLVAGSMLLAGAVVWLIGGRVIRRCNR
jgi:hypothetical protein